MFSNSHEFIAWGVKENVLIFAVFFDQTLAESNARESLIVAYGLKRYGYHGRQSMEDTGCRQSFRHIIN